MQVDKLILILFSVVSATVLPQKALFAQCDILGPSGAVCANSEVDFSVANPTNSAYEWDFDNDGTIDAVGRNVSYQFPAVASDQTYSVKLYQGGEVCNTRRVTIRATADPSIGVPANGGVLEDRIIRICSGVPSVNISIFNNSETMASNASYKINWGDGSPVENHDNSTFNNTSLLRHTYEGFGFYDLTITVEGNGICDNVGEYQVYIGSNPSVGLGTPGNTVGLCAPVTLTFPITNTGDNPEGTLYDIYVNGERVATFNQLDIPPYYTHTFTRSSCGEMTSTGNYLNAFDLQIIATNPCGSSTATVEPIEVSEPSEPLFLIIDSLTCTGSTVTFKNVSDIKEVVSGTPSRCENELGASWGIRPITGADDWVLVDGNLFSSDEIEVDFNSPGTYEITITINSPSCGTTSFSDTLRIDESPSEPGATLRTDTQGRCAPGTITLVNRSQGPNLTYNWNISPEGGWTFTDGTNAKSKSPVIDIKRGGTFKVFMEGRNGCGSISWDTVLVFEGRPLVDLLEPPDACQSAVLNFDESLVTYQNQGNPITQYYWEFPGASMENSREAFPQNIRYDGVGVYAYRVAVTNACGTTTAEDTLFVINPRAVDMPNIGQVCESRDPVRLNPKPRGGIWSGPGVTAAGLFDPSEAGIGVHRLNYRFGEGSCSVEGNMDIEVIPPPSINVGPDLKLCEQGDPVRLNANPGGGVWSADGNLVENDRFYPARSGLGSFQVYYEYQDESNCTSLDSITVNVVELPAVTAEDMTFCEGPGTVALPEGTPSGGIWDGPGVSDNAFDPSLAGGEGEYALNYSFTNSNGCTGTATATVTVVGASYIDAGPDLRLCAADNPVDLSRQGSPAGGRWRSTSGGVSGAIFDPSRVAPGRHTVTYEIGVGNCVLKDKIVIDVEEVPEIDFGETPTFICGDQETEVILTATPEGGIWRPDDNAVFNGNIFNAAASGPGVYTFTYTFSSGLCAAEKSVEISVGTTPEVSVRDTLYCDGPGRVLLPTGAPAGGRWYGPGVQGKYFYPERAGGVGFYDLEYRYVTGGCVGTASSKVEVIPTADVEAGPDSTVCMSDGIIELSGYSPEGGRWNGPGITDNRTGVFDPGNVGEGTYQLIYTVGNSGCVVRDTIALTVIEPIEVSAGPALKFCPEDNAVTLEGASPGGGRWSGPGVTGNRFDPGVLDPGLHILSYAITDNLTGCVTSAKRQITVHPQPQSIFQAPAVSCINDTLKFNNQSLGGREYRWDFGNGGTSALSNPTYIYEEGGNYDITLISSNEFGCSDTLSRIVNVGSPPKASFELDIDDGCAPLTVAIDNGTTGEGVAYLWDLGNGRRSTSPEPAPVIFEQGRSDTTYVIKLTVANQCAASTYNDTIRVHPTPIADFGVPVDTSCTPMTTVFTNRSAGNPEWYLWNLGNGTTSRDSIPMPQTYTTDTATTVYTITMVAGNVCGKDTATHDIYVTPVDVNAFFNVPSLQGCAPYQVQFTNLATRGAFVSWEFGDGTQSSEPNPVFTYTEPGEYTVRQYASTSCGIDSIEQVIIVHPSPDVSFSVPEVGCVNDEVLFENNSEGTIGQFWFFGDGESSQVRSPSHTFDAPGEYLVVLRGISAFNQCTARDTAMIRILGKPQVAFEPSAYNGCTPLRVNFRNQSAEPGYFYSWDFGEGNTSSAESPVHIFTEPGTHPVTLTVSDVYGCSADTSDVNITVYPVPDTDFQFDPEIGCGLPSKINFINQTEGAIGYTWNFGDGTSSTFNQPGEHFFYEGGRYQISLIATNSYQCADTLVKPLDIFPTPQAKYEIEDARGCSPLEVKFRNLSTANHYNWEFGDGSGSLEPNPVHVYTRPGKYEVRLVVSFNEVCFDTLELGSEIEVLPSPFADFDFEPDPNLGLGGLQLINLSEGATKFYWEFGDGATSEEENPTHRFLTNGVQQIYLEAVNIYGCVDDTLKAVRSPLLKGLFVPNAFSPEAGIGEVRLFKPKGVGLKEYHIRVFSPYGELVWESNALEEGQPAEAWDGTVNGQLLPQDVYVWKAYAIFEDGSSWRGMPDENGNYKTIGSVTILR